MATTRRFATGKPLTTSTRGPKAGTGIKTHIVIRQLYQEAQTAHQIYVMTEIPVEDVSRILYRLVKSGVAKQEKRKGNGDGRRAPVYRLYAKARIDLNPRAKNDTSTPVKAGRAPTELREAIYSIARMPKL